MKTYTTAALPYASEMTFMSIRGPIGAGMNVNIVLGQLITYGVIRETRKLGDSLIYKMLFAMQFVFLRIGLSSEPPLEEMTEPVLMGRHKCSDEFQIQSARNTRNKTCHDGKQYEVVDPL